MASFDYIATRDEAEAILAEFGFKMLITRYASVVDPVAETVVRTVVLQQNLTAAVLPATEGNLGAFEVKDMDGVEASTNTRFCYVSAKDSTFLPSTTDVAEYWEGEWQIMGCTPLNVNGTAILYRVGLRKP